MHSQHLLISGLRISFVATSASVLIARNIPVLRRTFIPYGKTRTGKQPTSNSVLRNLADITVPKYWFWHYYLVSVSLSLFWVAQFAICTRGNRNCLFSWLAALDGRCCILWAMMAVQGGRRLYESVCVQKSSSAKMWIGHYVVGVVFYIAMSLTVFAEASARPIGSTLMRLV